MPAGGRCDVAPRRGIWMQRTMRPSMRLALAFALARRRRRSFLSLARRRAGIVWRLGRQAELGFEFGFELGDPCAKLLDARQKRQDQGVFLGVAEGIKRRQRSHARLDSYSPRLRQPLRAK